MAELLDGRRGLLIDRSRLGSLVGYVALWVPVSRLSAGCHINKVHLTDESLLRATDAVSASLTETSHIPPLAFRESGGGGNHATEDTHDD